MKRRKDSLDQLVQPAQKRKRDSPKQLAQSLHNLQKIAEERRTATHCQRGHLITGRHPSGKRYCKICRRDNDHRKRMQLLVILTLNPDDHRHGSSYAYNAGCRCFRCRIAYSRAAEKRRMGKNNS